VIISQKYTLSDDLILQKQNVGEKAAEKRQEWPGIVFVLGFFKNIYQVEKENGPNVKTSIVESNIKRTQSKIMLQK
jgi:hypothetical protein